MTVSGLGLLKRARSLDADGLRVLAGPGATEVSDNVTRPALVTALLSTFTEADRVLIRDLTRFEIAAVRDDPGGGAGDVLLACCWLLFRIGRVEDSALIWEAKELNFDTFNYIDSVFLIPDGIAATAAFARRSGFSDLADYIAEGWLDDPDGGVEGWRTGGYFASRPGPEQMVETLAAWITT